MAVVVGDVRGRRNCGPLPRPKDHEDVPVQATNPKKEEAPRRPTSPPTNPPTRRQGTCRSCSTSRSTSSSCTRRRGTSPSSSSSTRRTTHQPHHKKKRHQWPRHKKGKEQPRKKKRHQKEQLQKATQAHKKKWVQPQVPLGQKTTAPNGRRSGRPKWWSKPLRTSVNDSARYTWYSACGKAHSVRCIYVARATLSMPVRTCTVAHFSHLSDSVFACVLGWMSNRECF